MSDYKTLSTNPDHKGNLFICARGALAAQRESMLSSSGRTSYLNVSASCADVRLVKHASAPSASALTLMLPGVDMQCCFYHKSKQDIEQECSYGPGGRRRVVTWNNRAFQISPLCQFRRK
jgi:hypothetical protein